MPKKYPKLRMRQAKLAQFRDGVYTVKLEFPFDPTDIANVKTLPGYRYFKEGRFWTVPPSEMVLRHLQEWDFIIDKKLKPITQRIGILHLGRK